MALRGRHGEGCTRCALRPKRSATIPVRGNAQRTHTFAHAHVCTHAHAHAHAHSLTRLRRKGNDRGLLLRRRPTLLATAFASVGWDNTRSVGNLLVRHGVTCTTESECGTETLQLWERLGAPFSHKPHKGHMRTERVFSIFFKNTAQREAGSARCARKQENRRRASQKRRERCMLCVP
jgi:hypothetical protein